MSGGRCRLVSPLVKLVGEHPNSAKAQAECPQRPSPWFLVHEEQAQCKNGYLQKGHIAIAVNEASAQKVIGIEMMHTKGAQETTPQQRHGFFSPSIGKPVDQARDKVRSINPENGPKDPGWVKPHLRKSLGHQKDQQHGGDQDRREFQCPSRGREFIMAGKGARRAGSEGITVLDWIPRAPGFRFSVCEFHGPTLKVHPGPTRDG